MVTDANSGLNKKVVQRKPHPCPYCPLVYYGKGALTTHINREHWHEQEEDRRRMAQE